MEDKKPIMSVPVSIVLAAVIIGGAWLLKGDTARETTVTGTQTLAQTLLNQKKTPSARPTELLIPWENLGAKLSSVGVLDRESFLTLYEGSEKEDARLLIDEARDGTATITEDNAGVVLNLLWALGLGQKSVILSEGPMMNPRYGGADRFAATGGWTLAEGGAMDHYGRHLFFPLTAEQEEQASRVTKNMFRPCCDNPAHFPDCNHGMAMLGLMELLASQGATDDELYDAALAVNTLWFPSQYAVISDYKDVIEKTGRTLSAKDLVGKNIASASGFQKVQAERAQWGTPQRENSDGGGGGGCSV